MKHFIVKHDLESFELLPNFIWNTEKSPKSYEQVKIGDRWIAFAYINNERQNQSISLITGFYECTNEVLYRDIPLPADKLDGEQKAWMIEGKEYGEQPMQPVGVRPIKELLGRPTFAQQSLIPIKPEEFEYIQKETLIQEGK